MSKISFFNFSLLALSSFFLFGCGVINFSSNIDPSNFKEYYKSSLVKLYSKDELVNLEQYDDLGAVEGIDCQINSLFPMPKESVAKKNMLEQSYDLGANAVIFDKCVSISDTLNCEHEISCFGRALKLNDDK